MMVGAGMPQPRQLEARHLVPWEGAATPSHDDVKHLSDSFNDGTLRRWAELDPGLLTWVITSSRLRATLTTGGAGGSFWYNANNGWLAYVAIDGDVEARMSLTVTNAAGGALDTNFFKLAGIAAHDPDVATYDYVHCALGGTAVGSMQCEHKSTVNNVSDPAGGDSPGYTSIAAPGGSSAILRVARVAQSIVYQAKDVAPVGAYSLVRSISRSAAPLPNVLRWGPMVYAADVGADTRADFHWVVFRRPHRLPRAATF